MLQWRMTYQRLPDFLLRDHKSESPGFPSVATKTRNLPVEELVVFLNASDLAGAFTGQYA